MFICPGRLFVKAEWPMVTRVNVGRLHDKKSELDMLRMAETVASAVEKLDGLTSDTTEHVN